MSATAEISRSADSDVILLYEENIWQRKEDTFKFLLQDVSLENIHWDSADQLLLSGGRWLRAVKGWLCTLSRLILKNLKRVHIRLFL